MTGFMEKDDGHNNIALMGDSHANALIPGLLINEGINDGILFFGTNCAIPFLGVQTGYGESWLWAHRLNYETIEKGYEYVLSHPEIKKVILTNFPGCFQFWGIRSLGNPSMTSTEEILSVAVSRTFDALSKAGKEVVYVLDVPTFSKDGADRSKVDACAAKVSSLHAPALPLRSALYLSKDQKSLDEVCSMPVSDNGAAEGHALMEKLVKRESAKYSNIHIVDLNRFFCDDKTCSMSQNGRMLYWDSQHLNWTGAAFVAHDIFKAFGE